MDISFAVAQQVLNQALNIANSEQKNISIAVVDAHGELVAFARMDDAPFHSAVLARNKAYTSARDRQPTSSLAKWAQKTGKDMGYWTDSQITGIAGGVPIIKQGRVVGAIGVSGLSEEEDEQVALQAIANLCD